MVAASPAVGSAAVAAVPGRSLPGSPSSWRIRISLVGSLPAPLRYPSDRVPVPLLQRLEQWHSVWPTDLDGAKPGPTDRTRPAGASNSDPRRPGDDGGAPGPNSGPQRSGGGRPGAPNSRPQRPGSAATRIRSDPDPQRPPTRPRDDRPGPPPMIVMAFVTISMTKAITILARGRHRAFEYQRSNHDREEIWYRNPYQIRSRSWFTRATPSPRVFIAISYAVAEVDPLNERAESSNRAARVVRNLHDQHELTRHAARHGAIRDDLRWPNR